MKSLKSKLCTNFWTEFSNGSLVTIRDTFTREDKLLSQKEELTPGLLLYAHTNHYPEELIKTFQGSGTDQRRLTIMNDDLRQAHYERF